MIPANQRFVPDDTTARDRYLGLIVEHELTCVDPFTQTGFDLKPGDSAFSHAFVEYLKPSLAFCFGVIHGGVRIAQEVLGRCTGEPHGNADAYGGKHLSAIDLERCIELFYDALSHVRGRRLVFDVTEQNRQFVAAQPGNSRLSRLRVALGITNART